MCPEKKSWLRPPKRQRFLHIDVLFYKQENRLLTWGNFMQELAQLFESKRLIFLLNYRWTVATLSIIGLDLPYIILVIIEYANRWTRGGACHDAFNK